MSKIKKIILSSMFLALFIIFNRFISIKTELLVISLTYIPIIMSAVLLGPKYSTIIALLGDLLGAIIFPFGPYFPGFTISSAITGLIYGLFLYNNGNEMSQKKFLICLVISSIIHLFLINIFLTSLWLHILYGKAYIAIISSRIISQIIMFPIQIITIYLLEKFSRPYVKKYLL